jgi:hypothetical protein
MNDLPMETIKYPIIPSMNEVIYELGHCYWHK